MANGEAYVANVRGICVVNGLCVGICDGTSEQDCDKGHKVVATTMTASHSTCRMHSMVFDLFSMLNRIVVVVIPYPGQKVYKYIYSAIPKRPLIWHYTV